MSCWCAGSATRPTWRPGTCVHYCCKKKERGLAGSDDSGELSGFGKSCSFSAPLFSIKQLYPRQGGLCPAVFMLCNFTEFCLAARRFSSSLICPCSWMPRGLFQCQRNRLTFRPFALGRNLTNWKTTEVLLCLSRKRIQSGQQAEGGMEWHFAEMTPLTTSCPTEGRWWG